MLLQKITEQELETISYLHDPNVGTAVLFEEKLPKLDSLKNFSEDSYFHTRLYQIPYHSYEYLVAHDPELSEEKNFELKKGAGSGYFYTGRKTGKSLVGLLMDMLLDTIHNFKDWVNIFSSFDKDHVEHILEPYIATMEGHPFFKLFPLKTLRRSPYKVETVSGHTLAGVGMGISSKKPGAGFEKHHAQKITIDEHQYETDEVANKRSQATSEVGCIERFAGITNFKKFTPAGRIFYNIKNRNWIVNLPEYVSPFWNEARKQEAIDDYGGIDTIGYRVHVLAEVVEDAIGVYDIERVRACYNSKKLVRHFEVDKDQFAFYRDLIIVDKFRNAFRTWICADWGRTAPSEIIILFEIERQDGNVFVYPYNISLYRLTPDEQFVIFQYLINKLNPNFVGIDATEEGGRQVFRLLERHYHEAKKQNSFIAVGFNEKIPVDFEYDENNKVKIRDGKPIYQYEMIPDWSVRRLKTLFYNKRIEI